MWTFGHVHVHDNVDILDMSVHGHFILLDMHMHMHMDMHGHARALPMPMPCPCSYGSHTASNGWPSVGTMIFWRVGFPMPPSIFHIRRMSVGARGPGVGLGWAH